MHLELRTKGTAGLAAVLVLLLTLTALHVSALSRLVVEENHERADLLASAIFHRARQVFPGSGDPYIALREDPGLKSILEASIFAGNIIGASIVDPNGVVIVSNDRSSEGIPSGGRADFGALASADVLAQLRAIYLRDGEILELRRYLWSGETMFATIQVRVSTVLMRRELSRALRTGYLALVAAMILGILAFAVILQLQGRSAGRQGEHQRDRRDIGVADAGRHR